MVTALQRKLLRDLRAMGSQVATIALVLACGVAGFITSFSAYDSLVLSRDRYYAEARFADVFATLKRAPNALISRLQSIPGVAHIETSLSHSAPLTIDGVTDSMVGQLIGLNEHLKTQLNRVQLRSGHMPQPAQSGALEALVSEGFATARALQAGDTVRVLMNGKRTELRIVGIALSPEYIFAGMGGSPDQRGFGIFWINQGALAAAYDMQGAFNRVALRLAPGASEAAVINTLNRLLERYGGNHAHGRDLQMSHLILTSEIKEQQVLGTVLPSIFLAVAGFILHAVTGRMIATQRQQIAALKALGYHNLQIGSHYLQWVMVIVFIGLALGLALGAVLGHWFVDMYATVFRFPELIYRLRPELMLSAAAVAIGSGVLATWSAVRSSVTLAPAEAMRPPAPGNYQPLPWERWFRPRWISPAMRMVLRSLQRQPGRTALTVLGIAAAMAIVISGAFWRDTIAMLLDTQFQQVLRGDITVVLTEPRPEHVLHALARLPYTQSVEGTRSASVNLVHGHLRWRGTLQGKPDQPALHRIVDTSLRVYNPPHDGLLLTDRLAKRLDLKVGDTVHIEFQEGQRHVVHLPVVGTLQEMMGMNAYIQKNTLHTLLREAAMVNHITLQIEQGTDSLVLQQLQSIPRIALAVSKTLMQRNIEEVTARNVLVFSGILTAFASIIAIGVVYNHARIALAERAWELASLRVLGFTRAEVSTLLLGEMAFHIVLALPMGMVLGYLLSAGIVSLIQTDEFVMPFVIQPATYAFAALCVLAAGVGSALIVRRRIDALDLIGVLKTRE
jgi:putative ABC transport system permease protein